MYMTGYNVILRMWRWQARVEQLLLPQYLDKTINLVCVPVVFQTLVADSKGKTGLSNLFLISWIVSRE
jgi:hypothetical protein